MRGSIGTWASRQSRHREPQRARDTAASMGAGERGARASMGAGNTGQSRQRWKLYRWTQPGAGDGQAPKHSRRAPGTWAKSAYPLFGVLRAIGALLMRGGIIPSERLKRATEGHRSRHKGHTPEGG